MKMATTEWNAEGADKKEKKEVEGVGEQDKPFVGSW